MSDYQKPIANPNQSFLNKLIFGEKYNVPVASQEVPFGPGNIGKAVKVGESLARDLQSLVNRLGKLRGTVTNKEASQIAREAQTYPGNAAAPARPVPPRPQRIVGPKPGPVTVKKIEPVGPKAVLAARMNNKIDVWNLLKNFKPPVKPEPVPSVVSEDIQALIVRGKRIQAELAADVENPMQRSSGFPGIDLRSAQAKAPIPKAQQQQASLKYGIQEALKHEEPLPGIYRWREDQAIAEMQTKQRADLAADAEQRYAEAAARQDWIEARLSQIRAEVSRIQGRMTGEVKPPQYLEQVTSDYPSQIAQTQEAEARVQTGLKEANAAERARAAGQEPRIPNVKTKAIQGSNAGKGTPVGDAKDVAMRTDSDSAIVELASGQRSVNTGTPNAVGRTSSETSLLQKGSPSGNMSGKVIMLARNGELRNQPLRKDTIDAIVSANKQGAKFIVGDMPGVDSKFVELLEKIKADYTVYHTGTTPRFPVRTQGR